MDGGKHSVEGQPSQEVMGPFHTGPQNCNVSTRCDLQANGLPEATCLRGSWKLVLSCGILMFSLTLHFFRHASSIENRLELCCEQWWFRSVLIVIFIHRRFEDIPDIGSESQGAPVQLRRALAFWL